MTYLFLSSIGKKDQSTGRKRSRLWKTKSKHWQKNIKAVGEKQPHGIPYFMRSKTNGRREKFFFTTPSVTLSDNKLFLLDITAPGVVKSVKWETYQSQFVDSHPVNYSDLWHLFRLKAPPRGGVDTSCPGMPPGQDATDIKETSGNH